MEKKLKLGCALDELLNGGLEPGIITEIYGEAGTGKTNICLQAARNCAVNGKKVVFIDSEGVSLERMHQICGDKYKKILPNILFFSPYSLEEQEEMIGKSSNIDAGLVILDTANMYYRLQIEKDEDGATHSLMRQLISLQIMAKKKEIPVIITGQVYSTKNGVEPFAGRSMEHIAKTIIKLKKTGEGKREATIIKHRSQPEGKKIKFSIMSNGLE